MALALAGYRGSITLIDQGANQSIKEYDLREATVYADALTDLQTIAGLLAPTTDAAVRGYSLTTLYLESAFSLPTGGVQIENIAELVLNIAGQPLKSARAQIPAPADTIFQSSSGKGYNIVDPSGAVYAYVNGVWGPTGVAYISDGEQTPSLNPVRSGKRIHRASRNG